MGNPDELKEKLRHAINYCSAEGLVGDMPDFIAAELLFDVLCAVGKAVKARDKWYGVRLRPPMPLVLHQSVALPGERSTSEYTPEEIAIAGACGKLRVDMNCFGWIRDMSPGGQPGGQVLADDDGNPAKQA